MAETSERNAGKSPSFKLLVSYSDSSDSESEESSVNPSSQNVLSHFVEEKEKLGNEMVIESRTDRRSVSSFESEETSSASSDDTSDSSSSSEFSDDEEDSRPSSSNDDAQKRKRDNQNTAVRNKSEPNVVKTKGELGLNDLPPIEDLKISVGKDALRLVGFVLSVVDCLVTIQANEAVPALNLDSMLFFENGDAFGQVFDVFGPVIRPLYAVRFNSSVDIANKNINLKMPVYYAPQKEEFTSFVFVDQLKGLKGCDASWKDDNEPPEDQCDFSDDEEERKVKAKLKEKKYQESNQHQNTKVFKKRKSNGKFNNMMQLDSLNSQGIENNGSCGYPLVRPPTFNYSLTAESTYDTFGQPKSFSNSPVFNNGGFSSSSQTANASPFLLPQPSSPSPASDYNFNSMTSTYQDKVQHNFCLYPPPPPPPSSATNAPFLTSTNIRLQEPSLLQSYPQPPALCGSMTSACQDNVQQYVCCLPPPPPPPPTATATPLLSSPMNFQPREPPPPPPPPSTASATSLLSSTNFQPREPPPPPPPTAATTPLLSSPVNFQPREPPPSTAATTPLLSSPMNFQPREPPPPPSTASATPLLNSPTNFQPRELPLQRSLPIATAAPLLRSPTHFQPQEPPFVPQTLPSVSLQPSYHLPHLQPSMPSSSSSQPQTLSNPSPFSLFCPPSSPSNK